LLSGAKPSATGTTAIRTKRSSSTSRPVDGRSCALLDPVASDLRLARASRAVVALAKRPYVPNALIHAQASSMSVRGRTTRTPSPERKCLTLTGAFSANQRNAYSLYGLLIFD
jgi:hypothetical protein